MNLVWVSPGAGNSAATDLSLRVLSHRVLPTLQRDHRVTVVTPATESSENGGTAVGLRAPWPESDLPVHRFPTPETWPLLNEADLVAFVLGDDAETFASTWELQVQHGGLVILLEPLHTLLRDAPPSPTLPTYRAAMAELYEDAGRRAVEQASIPGGLREPLSNPRLRFPLTSAAVAHAEGVLTHHPEVFSRLVESLRCPVVQAPAWGAALHQADPEVDSLPGAQVRLETQEWLQRFLTLADQVRERPAAEAWRRTLDRTRRRLASWPGTTLSSRAETTARRAIIDLTAPSVGSDSPEDNR